VKQISTIGLDLAKNVFQIHGADAEGAPIFNRKLRRAESCAFSRSFRRVWSDWRRAAVRIIGRARSRRSVTTCA